MPNTTKYALEQSLKNLLLEKPLNKITVKDITEDCKINRMTFYYHFQDIYALIEWICEEEVLRVLENKRTYETWEEGFLSLFHALNENKIFIANVYRSLNKESIEIYLYKLANKILLDVINEISKDISIKEEDKLFIANFYKYAFVGIILEWIRMDMKKPPEDIINKLSTLLEGDIVNAINKFKIY